MLGVMQPQVTLTNPDKVLYPATGTTKQQVFDYYTQIAPVMLPHLLGRPATRKVWPNGVAQPMFYSKDASRGTPDWIERVPIQHQNSVKDYPLLNTEAALQWDAQTAGLEIHVPQWRIDDAGKPLPPDRMVIDLDPGEKAGLKECAKVAFLVKDIVNGMGLELYPCTSGSKGIHLYAPLKPQKGKAPLTSAQVSDLAKELARHLEAEHPDLVISTLSKAARVGKVMVDWSQNNGKKTTISPYSLRGTAEPYAVAPRTWEEIADPNLRQLTFTEVLARAKKQGDLISGLLGGKTQTKIKSLKNSQSTRDSALPQNGPQNDGNTKQSGPLHESSSPPNGMDKSEPALHPPRHSARSPLRAESQNLENVDIGIEVPSPMLAVMASQGELAMLEKDGNSDNPQWRYEMKWDGYRVIAIVTKNKDNSGNKLRLLSRNGQDYTDRYPELEPLAERVGTKLPVVLDGEIVALTKTGQPSFRDLQAHSLPVSIEVFDILQIGDKHLGNEPLTKRRDLLEKTVTEAGPVHISPELPYADAISISEKFKLEGVMAKRASSKYQPGARSKDWLKIKHLQAGIYYIVGWKPYHAGDANENLNAIGSLLMARKTAPNTYQFVGRVGTGFTEQMRRELQATLSQLNTEEPPKGITALTKPEQTAAQWVKPKLQGKVEFAEWTTADPDAPQARLRHPRWRGLI